MIDLPFILDCRFRTGTAFLLKEWHQLQDHERQLVTQLAGEDDVYGLFLPALPGEHLTAKLAYTDTALLYFHFQCCPHLPKAFLNRNEDAVNKTLLHLVLDRVLEIEWKEKFVGGSDALEALYGHRPFAAATAPPFLSSLSMRAISMAFLLRHREVKPLAHWLYACHTWPMDAQAKQQFTNLPSVADFLFPDANTRQRLDTAWRFIPPHADFSWYSWLKPQATHDNNQPIFKLYISPAPAEIPAVLTAVVPVLIDSEAFCFKAGATVEGLLRPDKLMVYFTRREALFQTAALLENRLPACRVHGVPFTCQLDQKGMLSWGTDPPASEVLEAVEDGSWRTFVTEQLALAILQAKREHLSFASAVPFLQAKMQVTGIQMDNWTAITA